MSLVARWRERKVLVVGDLILDEYLLGLPTRLSREAPVPVLELERREYIPGGAANPARNLAALGARAFQAGVIGDDAEGQRLREQLAAAGVDVAALLLLPGRTTTTKMRVLAAEPLRFPQQLARIDRLERRPLAAEQEDRLLALLESYVPQMDALLCSDYRQGLFSPRLAAQLRALCQRHGVLQTVDAQGAAELYTGVDLFRCNAGEAAAIVGHALSDEAAFAAALPAIRAQLDARNLIVTRGPEGLALIGESMAYTILPAANRSEVFDTTGAGDTFIAVATLALSAGADLLQAALLANTAAGLVVRRLGNAVVTPEELERQLRAEPA